jgi:hypothetical protein
VPDVSFHRLTLLSSPLLALNKVVGKGGGHYQIKVPASWSNSQGQAPNWGSCLRQAPYLCNAPSKGISMRNNLSKFFFHI